MKESSIWVWVAFSTYNQHKFKDDDLFALKHIGRGPHHQLKPTSICSELFALKHSGVGSYQ